MAGQPMRLRLSMPRWGRVSFDQFFESQIQSEVMMAGLRSCLIVTILYLLISSPLLADVTTDRPVPPGGGATRIYCIMAILDLDQISDAEQSFTVNLFVKCRWMDPREAHSGSGRVIKSLGEVWSPRLFFLNRQRVWSSWEQKVEISPQGELSYRQNFWGDFSQPMNLQDFPFDSQNLEIVLVNADAPNYGQVDLLPDPEMESFVNKDSSVVNWTITGSEIKAEPYIFPTGIKVKALSLGFSVQRQSEYHLIKFIAPLLLILVLSWVVFWLDPTEGGAQLGVAVTTCLTVIAYHLALASSLPMIPYLTQMDVFVFGATLLVFLAMIEVVTTTGLAKTGHVKAARWMDRMSRLVFPGLLALIMFYAFAWR